MLRSICLIVGAALALAGCNMATSQDTQADDIRNPHYKQAQQDLDSQNFTAAAADYEAALAANPSLPGAQYQLGVLYGDKLQDPVASIYHYKRFLELAPNSDHAVNAKAAIEKQRQAFAASLPASTEQTDQITKLQEENALLKKQVGTASQTITKLQGQLAKAGKHHASALATAAPVEATPAADDGSPASATPVPVAEAVTPAEAAAPANAAPAAPMRALPLGSTNEDASPAAPAAAPAPYSGPSHNYTVVHGDTVSRIAGKMYPGHVQSGIKKIEDANRDTMPDPARLKIGQVLIIPE